MEIQQYAVAESGFRRRRFLITCLSVTLLLCCGTPAWAHHSFAMYDLQNPIDVKGTVKEFRFLNPHSWIILSVEDETGKSSDYTLETNGSFYLGKREGWKRNSLKPGDVVVAQVNPMRDGSQGGDLIKVTLSDGSELIARRPGTGPAAAVAEEKK